MKQKSAPWIRVWPFDNRELIMNNSGSRIRLSQEAKDYINKNWETNHKGWTSSWIALADNINFGEDKIQMNMGAMQFHEAIGLVKSIEYERDFVLEEYVNELSTGILIATNDSYLIFTRRGEGVHLPKTFFPPICGYFSSMNFASRKECDLQRYADDERLFNPEFQLKFRQKEAATFLNLPEESISYNPSQDFLACGWLTKEMYLSTTGKADITSEELKSLKKDIILVPFENLKELIHNQGRLSKINPIGYHPPNTTEIILPDEPLVSLIFDYEKLTGEKLDIEDTIKRLKYDGLEIMVHDTSPGKFYDFPLEFGFSPSNKIKKLITGANTKVFEYFTEKDKKQMKTFYSRKWGVNKVKGINSENLIQNIFHYLSNDFNFNTEVHNTITRRRNNPARYDEGKGFVDTNGNPITDYGETREKVCKGLVNYLCDIKKNSGKTYQEIKGSNLVKYLR